MASSKKNAFQTLFFKQVLILKRFSWAFRLLLYSTQTKWLKGRKEKNVQKKKPASERRSALRRAQKIRRKGEQIIGTQDEPQMLVAQRLLAILQCLDSTKSSTMDLSVAWITLWLSGSNLCRLLTKRWNQAGPISFHVATQPNTTLLSQQGFRLRGVQS